MVVAACTMSPLASAKAACQRHVARTVSSVQSSSGHAKRAAPKPLEGESSYHIRASMFRAGSCYLSVVPSPSSGKDCC
eukprot:9484195-Pyramimonas_sp.AAC.1